VIRKSRVLVIGAVLVVSAIATGVWRWHAHRSESTAPIVRAADAGRYVDNKQCLGCHAQQAAQWLQSHHAMAMAAPSEYSVRGDFNNSSFMHRGVTSRFFRRDGQYFVNTDGPDGRLADFEIAWTFGVAPLQQYLIALPDGRLQALQIAWDTQRSRWFPLQAGDTAPAGDPLHWTGRYQTANTMCLSCHTTGFEKRYDAAADAFASRWAESNVSCQSCHGPGERHLNWAQTKQQGRKTPDITGTHYGLAVNPALLTGRQQVEVCAACHSRRSELVAAPVPGSPRLDHYVPGLLRAGLYHADGQQLDEVYVDGSFRQSVMYGKGVSCTHCHDAHTGKLQLVGNAVCTQCHGSAANAAFPGAAGSYDTPAHHFHKEGSVGAQCTGCHMPAKTFMQIQARPDHSIRIPRPDLSAQLGTPNACNQCHQDRSAQWAAERVATWYGPRRRQEPQYGEVFAAARTGKAEAMPALARLSADVLQPAIVRASALDALRNDGTTGIDERVAATRDADPEVRAAAADSFDAVPPERRLPALAPLLRDPVRAVRVAAARSLSALPRTQLSADQQQAYDAALAEYIAAQELALDMPGAHLNLAVLRENSGQPLQAEQHYRAALRIDPDFTPAQANLANLYNALGRNADAERVLVEALKRRPQTGELHYSLGLLLAEEQRLPEAAVALANAARLLPGHARVHYNLGLALQQLGRFKAAEAALLKAQAADPLDPDPVYALATFHAQQGQRRQATRWIEALRALPSCRRAPSAAQCHIEIQGGVEPREPDL
jgi:tetratricopeptide (TPR) repeat protein